MTVPIEEARPSEAMGMQWGDKGCVPDKSQPEHLAHAADDGCMWCCMRCNTDTHWCPGCGTVADHKNTPCPECVVLYQLDKTS